MSGIERDLGFHRGARFIQGDGVVLFSFGIDPNNVIGPREATTMDQAAFPDEWEVFRAVQEAPAKNRGGRPRKAPP